MLIKSLLEKILNKLRCSHRIKRFLLRENVVEYCNSFIRKDLLSLIESLVGTPSIYSRTEA